MVRKSDEYWIKHIESWKISNLTSNSYCRKVGLVNSTFQRWIKKMDHQKIKPVKINLPVESYSSKMIILEFSGIKLSFPVDIPATLLTVAIREIKRCS